MSTHLMPVRRAAARRSLRRGALAAVAAVGLLGASLSLANPAQAANPYQRGPAPTVASISAATGPFATTSKSILGLGQFGGATIYYPTSTAQGKYGVVAIVPGFVAFWSEMAWLGPRLASQGFVVIGMDTNVPWDLTQDRAREIAAAITAAKNDATVAQYGDFSRVAISGWSMGGGGVLDAASTNHSYKAVIPIAPWEITTQFSKVTTPTLIIGGQKDAVAPDATMSLPDYKSISGPKTFLELTGADHFFTTKATATQAAAMIAFLKRYVDNDSRYTRFLCPKPAVNGGTIDSYLSTTC